MSSKEERELNLAFETAELRSLLMSTGISDFLEDDLPDIELESSESLLARLKSLEESNVVTAELNLEFETAELYSLMMSTGISVYLEDDLPDIELESSESLMARLTSLEKSNVVTPMPTRRSRRRLVPTLLAGTAAAVVAGVLIAVQPWGTPVAQASTPPMLDYEFAEAARIADAPGVDPAGTLEQLALAAQRTRSGTSASAVQHVVTEGWSIDNDFNPDPDSTITPTRTESWLRPDGSFRTRNHLGEPLSADGRGVPLGGRLDRRTEFFDEATEPTGSQDANLFTDMPNTIDDIRNGLLDNIGCLDRRRGQERSWCLTDQLRNLPQIYVIPPDFMATIWRMLAEEEGIRSLGTVKDRTGREAVALSFIWDGAPEYRAILLADPRTGQVVGSERILIKASSSSPVKPPAIEEFFTVVTSESQ
jgi:hypothetical protein